MLQVVKIVEADIEILAQINIQVTQIKIVTAVCVTQTHSQVLGYKVTHIGRNSEYVSLHIQVLQHQQVLVLVLPLAEVDCCTAHPHTLWDEWSLQFATVYTLDVALLEILLVVVAYLIIIYMFRLLTAYHFRIRLPSIVRPNGVLIILREYCYRHESQQQYQHNTMILMFIRHITVQ